MARKKNASRKAAQHSAARNLSKASKTPPVTIQSLPPDLISRILFLTGQPAAFATVCRSWKNVVRDCSSGSALWTHVDLYSHDRSGSFHVAPHGHHLCIWLRQRVTSVQSITFHRFTNHQVFLSTALGLLSRAPLRRLEFDQCLIDAELLPGLLVTTNLTHLALRSLSARADVKASMLNAVFARLPLLEDLEMRFDGQGRSIVLEWPAALTACQHLTRLTLEGFPHLPADIGNLVNLEALTMYGKGLMTLPASVGRLTRLTSLTSVPKSTGRTQESGYLTSFPPEAAGLTALQRLTLATMAFPAYLSEVTALTCLEIRDLNPFNMVTANMLEAAVACMRGLRRLRLIRCRLQDPQMPGLPNILAKVPSLTELRLDDNMLRVLGPGDLGPHASALQMLSMSDSMITTVPEELKRAVGCRSLTLSFLSVDRALGSRAALSSSPLLAMPQLRELRLAQVDWKSEDVEAMLDLQKAFSARRGPSVAIRCPRVERVEPQVPDQPDLSDEDGWDEEDEDEDNEFEDEEYWDEGGDIDYDMYGDDLMGSGSDDGMDGYGYPMY